MIPIWPHSLPQAPRRNNWTGGPRDERIRFEPDRGPPIDRVGATGATEEFNASFMNLSNAQRATFRAWFDGDLAKGTQWFAWRDPVIGDVSLWKIMSDGRSQAYSFTAKGAGWNDLSLNLMRRPGAVWYAPYVAEGVLRLPYVVADYTNDVFGVDLARSPAASVAAVSGVFDVFTTRPGSSTLVERGHTVTAGDIPATAPVGVTRILAFPVL